MKKRIHLELRNRTPSDVSWPHMSLVMFHTQLMENLSCDVLAWGYKVSYKLKDDGDVGSHCCFAMVFTVGRCCGYAA